MPIIEGGAFVQPEIEGLHEDRAIAYINNVLTDEDIETLMGMSLETEDFRYYSFLYTHLSKVDDPLVLFSDLFRFYLDKYADFIAKYPTIVSWLKFSLLYILKHSFDQLKKQFHSKNLNVQTPTKSTLGKNLSTSPANNGQAKRPRLQLPASVMKNEAQHPLVKEELFLNKPEIFFIGRVAEILVPLDFAPKYAESSYSAHKTIEIHFTKAIICSVGPIQRKEFTFYDADRCTILENWLSKLSLSHNFDCYALNFRTPFSRDQKCVHILDYCVNKEIGKTNNQDQIFTIFNNTEVYIKPGYHLLSPFFLTKHVYYIPEEDQITKCVLPLEHGMDKNRLSTLCIMKYSYLIEGCNDNEKEAIEDILASIKARGGDATASKINKIKLNVELNLLKFVRLLYHLAQENVEKNLKIALNVYEEQIPILLKNPVVDWNRHFEKNLSDERLQTLYTDVMNTLLVALENLAVSLKFSAAHLKFFLSSYDQKLMKEMTSKAKVNRDKKRPSPLTSPAAIPTSSTTKSTPTKGGKSAIESDACNEIMDAKEKKARSVPTILNKYVRNFVHFDDELTNCGEANEFMAVQFMVDRRIKYRRHPFYSGKYDWTEKNVYTVDEEPVVRPNYKKIVLLTSYRRYILNISAAGMLMWDVDTNLFTLPSYTLERDVPASWLDNFCKSLGQDLGEKSIIVELLANGKCIKFIDIVAIPSANANDKLYNKLKTLNHDQRLDYYKATFTASGFDFQFATPYNRNSTVSYFSVPDNFSNQVRRYIYWKPEGHIIAAVGLYKQQVLVAYKRDHCDDNSIVLKNTVQNVGPMGSMLLGGKVNTLKSLKSKLQEQYTDSPLVSDQEPEFDIDVFEIMQSASDKIVKLYGVNALVSRLQTVAASDVASNVEEDVKIFERYISFELKDGRLKKHSHLELTNASEYKPTKNG